MSTALLMGDGALRSPADWQTQSNFDNNVVVYLNNIFNTLKSMQGQINDTNVDVNKKGLDIDNLKDSFSSLQSNFKALSQNYANLETDNTSFKSDVDTTISHFNDVISQMSGSITALTKNTQQNTNDILSIKQNTDNDLLKQVMTGLNSLQDMVSSIIANIYQPKIDALASKQSIDNANLLAQVKQNNASLNEGITSNATAISNLSDVVTKNATTQNASISANTTAISDESARAQSAEQDLLSQSRANSNAINVEVTRAKQAESDLSNAISQSQQTCLNHSDDNLRIAKNYADEGLSKNAANTSDAIAKSKASIEAEFTSADETVQNNSYAYTDKLRTQFLDVANNALATASTASGIAEDARTKALDAEGKYNDIKPQVDANTKQSSQALALAQSLPKASFTITQGQNYADSFIAVSQQGSSCSISAKNGYIGVGSYNGGSLNALPYTLSSGYIYSCKVMGAGGFGEYIIDNRNSSNCAIYAYVTNPVSN